MRGEHGKMLGLLSRIIRTTIERAIKAKVLTPDLDCHPKDIQYLERAFERVVRRRCGDILLAAKVKPCIHKEMEIRGNEVMVRKLLADELKMARKKLRELEWKINNGEAAASKIVREWEGVLRREARERLLSAKASTRALRLVNIEQSRGLVAALKPTIDKAALGMMYPSAPPPISVPTKYGSGMPFAPGVYFLWLGNSIEYVGKSVNLYKRLRLGSHHVLCARHRISFIIFRVEDLNWAEYFYIGAIRPTLNFGGSGATHVMD